MVCSRELRCRKPRRTVLLTLAQSYSCISFFFNYLDRAALANAYVSGMQEDLKLKGTNLNVINTCLTVGCELADRRSGTISTLHRRYHRPGAACIGDPKGPTSYLVLGNGDHLGWSDHVSQGVVAADVVRCCAAARNFSDLCAIRFFQGLIEASTYSGTQYIIGSWYKPAEIGKRTGLFAASGMAGTMFSGIMMTAINDTMNGRSGLQGWKWVSIRVILC